MSPEHRIAQKLLAEEVTLMVHGSQSLSRQCLLRLKIFFTVRGWTGRSQNSNPSPFWHGLCYAEGRADHQITDWRSPTRVLH